MDKYNDCEFEFFESKQRDEALLGLLYNYIVKDKNDFSDINEKTLGSKKFIAYPGANYYYNKWLKHTFPQRQNLNDHALIFTGEINSIYGAIQMAVGGLGMLVIPLHCISKQLESKKLFIYPETEPLHNDIYIASIKEHKYPTRITTVIEWFFDMNSKKTA